MTHIIHININMFSPPCEVQPGQRSTSWSLVDLPSSLHRPKTLGFVWEWGIAPHQNSLLNRENDDSSVNFEGYPFFLKTFTNIKKTQQERRLCNHALPFIPAAEDSHPASGFDAPWTFGCVPTCDRWNRGNARRGDPTDVKKPMSCRRQGKKKTTAWMARGFWIA